MRNTFSGFWKLFLALLCCLALAACGSSPTIVCNASGGATCICGSGAVPTACPIMPGPEFLYASSIGGPVTAFSINQNTGALTTIGSVPGPLRGIYPMAAVNHQFLFAPDSFNAQLYGFSIDQTTGALTALANSPFSTGTFSIPAGLASPPGGSLLYASDITGIDGFSVSGSGIPTVLSQSPFSAGDNRYLAADPSGNFIYTWDDNPLAGIFAFTIDSTGALTAVPNSPFTVPGQAAQDIPLSGIVDTGFFVYVSLSGTNQIAGFSIVSGTGALDPVPNSPFAAGATPNALVFTNGLLYAANLDGTISGYSVDSSTGMLTPLANSPFNAAGTSLAVDSFGQYLYANAPGGIQAFKIDSTSGGLSQILGSPFPATEPDALTVVQMPPP